MSNKVTIKEELRRKLLLEKKGDSHSYGCVMLFFDIGKGNWKKIQSMIDDDDIYTEEGDESYGRENEPHVTILYGLHDDIPDATIEELVNEITPTKLVLKKISIFENDKFDVVKFDITGVSKGRLEKMNAKFAELPHTTDYPDYHPHATIVYVKAGMGKKYVQTLSTEDAITVDCNDVVYSKADDTKNKYKLK
jgi:2'-5' RNA ligase|tara:strand:- start:26806 stop:27384 length:579 start_codon:yes stop_codon:yes gene_type:complete